MLPKPDLAGAGVGTGAGAPLGLINGNAPPFGVGATPSGPDIFGKLVGNGLSEIAPGIGPLYVLPIAVARAGAGWFLLAIALPSPEDMPLKGALVGAGGGATGFLLPNMI
jgi:hypothetical protein